MIESFKIKGGFDKHSRQSHTFGANHASKQGQNNAIELQLPKE